MPFKHNASRRDKFAKAKCRVANWPEYDESLRQRGDVTVWFSVTELGHAVCERVI